MSVAIGKARSGRDGRRDQLGRGGVSLQDAGQRVDPLARHGLWLQARPGHGLQAAPARGQAEQTASRSRAASSRWIGAACGEPAELALQLGPLGGRQIGPHQPFAEDAGQRAGPLGMPADDPRGRLLERRLGRGQQPRDELRVETAAVHLVERDHRGPASFAGSSLDSPAAVAFGSPISIKA